MEGTAPEEATDPEVGTGAPEGSEAPDAEASDAEEPVDELTEARNERDAAVDKWMRLQADFQNHRRHAQANIDAAAQRARSEVLGEALTILDYLDMALATEVTTDEAKNLKLGVEMTRGQLGALLDRMSVRAIDATGAFDPARHQAVTTVETDEVEPGTIVEVVRSGWTLGEDVLRFAQVRVAARPEANDSEASDSADDASANEGAEQG
ncbi:MAG: nucleotide exchange factor GrpE [Planctomycetota bacterium]